VTGDENGARLQSTTDHAAKQLHICRLLLVTEHRLLILPPYLNETAEMVVFECRKLFIAHFSFLSISVHYVKQTTISALRSNQMRSQADLFLHTLLEGNKLSNGKGILLNENSFNTFLITY